MSDTPRDPSEIDEPHDILAADEFEIGTRDARRPPDPSGIEEAHDVLAAEEFAMPAPETAGSRPQTADKARYLPVLLVAAVVAFVLLRRR